jgi:hypothetical protein
VKSLDIERLVGAMAISKHMLMTYVIQGSLGHGNILVYKPVDGHPGFEKGIVLRLDGHSTKWPRGPWVNADKGIICSVCEASTGLFDFSCSTWGVA